MATDPERQSASAAEEQLSLAELVEQSGLPGRTIRWYQSEGLLPKPAKQGREAVYGPEHVERLRLIADLRDRGLTLVAIRDLLRTNGRRAPWPSGWGSMPRSLRRGPTTGLGSSTATSS